MANDSVLNNGVIPRVHIFIGLQEQVAYLVSDYVGGTTTRGEAIAKKAFLF